MHTKATIKGSVKKNQKDLQGIVDSLALSWWVSVGWFCLLDSYSVGIVLTSGEEHLCWISLNGILTALEMHYLKGLQRVTNKETLLRSSLCNTYKWKTEVFQRFSPTIKILGESYLAVACGAVTEDSTKKRSLFVPSTITASDYEKRLVPDFFLFLNLLI